jgi:hypothetical protein
MGVLLVTECLYFDVLRTILVGNFSDGTINAFDSTGESLARYLERAGQAIQIRSISRQGEAHRPAACLRCWIQHRRHREVFPSNLSIAKDTGAVTSICPHSTRSGGETCK